MLKISINLILDVKNMKCSNEIKIGRKTIRANSYKAFDTMDFNGRWLDNMEKSIAFEVRLDSILNL